MKVIFYNKDEILYRIDVAPGYDYKIVADKDVPAGLLYKFLDEEQLPSKETMGYWEMEINESNADGKGLTPEEFYAKYPDLKDWSVQ